MTTARILESLHCLLAEGIYFTLGSIPNGAGQRCRVLLLVSVHHLL